MFTPDAGTIKAVEVFVIITSVEVESKVAFYIPSINLPYSGTKRVIYTSGVCGGENRTVCEQLHLP